MHLEICLSIAKLLHERGDELAELFLLDGEMSELLMLDLYEVIRSDLGFFRQCDCAFVFFCGQFPTYRKASARSARLLHHLGVMSSCSTSKVVSHARSALVP